MDLSIFIAQLIAVIYLAVGLGMLLDKKYYDRLLNNFYKDETAMYIGGFLALIVGFVIVSFHNEWVKSWEVLVTIVGWLSLIKGVGLITFPTKSIELSKSFVKGKKASGLSYIVIILGLIFGYFGFMA